MARRAPAPCGRAGDDGPPRNVHDGVPGPGQREPGSRIPSPVPPPPPPAAFTSIPGSGGSGAFRRRPAPGRPKSVIPDVLAGMAYTPHARTIDGATDRFTAWNSSFGIR